VYEAVRAGAYSYISKDAGRREICDAVAGRCARRHVLSKKMQAELVAHVRGRHEDDRPLLTRREQEVLTYLARIIGATDSREALPEHDDRQDHLGNLYGKLGVSDRAAAVAEAMRRGCWSSSPRVRESHLLQR